MPQLDGLYWNQPSEIWNSGMDRLEAMQVFLGAVEGGSLSAAGRQLGMPLATVSRKLSELEAHLKARLLNRSTRGLTLTDAGRDYLAACKRILEDVGEAERAAAGEFSEPRGELVITAPIVFGRLHVLPVTNEFLAAYPEVDVRLVLGDRIVHLLDEHVDLAVRVGELPDSRLTATRLGATRRVVCASPAYLAAHGRPRKPGDLAKHACISFRDDREWVFPTERVAIRPRLQVTTAEAAIDAALAGVGIARVLSYQIRDRALERLLVRHEPPPVPVHLVRTSAPVPRKLRAFLDLAHARLKPLLDR
jgi:DNA-binding transcriptional LysR family regulator